MTNQRKLLAVAAVALLCFISIALARPCFDGMNSAVNLWATSIQTQGLTEAAKIVDFDTKILLYLSPSPVYCSGKAVPKMPCLLIGAMGLNSCAGADLLLPSLRCLSLPLAYLW